jgi:hypothetical protein
MGLILEQRFHKSGALNKLPSPTSALLLDATPHRLKRLFRELVAKKLKRLFTISSDVPFASANKEYTLGRRVVRGFFIFK